MRPEAGNPCSTGRTVAILRDVHLRQVKTVAFNEQVIAGVAVSVFPATDAARQVARINVAQTRCATDLARA
jgi:hypothetical protein